MECNQEQTDQTHGVVRSELENVEWETSDVELQLGMNYDYDESEHEELVVIWVVEVGSDSELGIEVDLRQEYQTYRDEQPDIQIGQQQNWIHHEKAAITYHIKPAEHRSRVQSVITRMENR